MERVTTSSTRVVAGFFFFCESLSPIRVDEDLCSKIALPRGGEDQHCPTRFASPCRHTPPGLWYPLAIFVVASLADSPVFVKRYAKKASRILVDFPCKGRNTSMEAGNREKWLERPTAQQGKKSRLLCGNFSVTKHLAPSRDVGC